MNVLLIRILVVLLVSTPLFAQGQINGSINSGRNKLCFQESLNRYGKKYVDWQCGQNDAIVDCNEKLESDPGSNLAIEMDCVSD